MTDWSRHPLAGYGQFYKKDCAAIHVQSRKATYTFGGCVDTPNPYKDSGDLHDEIARYVDGHWEIVGKCPERRASGSAVLLDEHRILVAGGWGDGWGNSGSPDCFVFDLRTEQATTTVSLLVARKRPRLTLQADGTVLVKSQEGKPELWSPGGSASV